MPIEIRQAGNQRKLVGSFPYGVTTELGPGRMEQIAPYAFRQAISDPKARIDLLVGHDFQQPIASRQAGSMTLTETAKAVEFEAVLPTDPPSWVVDMVKAIESGLMVGLSPGFMLSQESGAVETVPQPGAGGALRIVHKAILRELSVVTAPAYVEGAGVELRSEPCQPTPRPTAPTGKTLWL